MRSPYQSYYYKESNEVGEQEVSYTYHITFFRKLLRMRSEVKTYIKNPQGVWYHKLIGDYPTRKEFREIHEVLEKIRQRKKYKFYMDHVFI